MFGIFGKRRREEREAEGAAEEPTTEAGFERIEAEPLTEEDVQKRMAELFKICDLQEGYHFSEEGLQLLSANLRLIESYVEIAKIKGSLQEAAIYLEIERMRRY